MSMHSPRPTGAARAAALAAAAMCGALFAQAVNLKPGKYEFVSTSQVTLAPEMQKRLPPGYLARLQKPRTQQQCITDVDLKQVGKQLSQGRGNDPSCKMTEHSVAGDKVKFVMQCQRATTHFEGTFSSDSFQAAIRSQTDQGPMTVKMTGRRIGDCSK
ncbi:MAG: DUF3617 domain-containing protein [Gammaproteobacteria bacterium]|nr:MAG: DUF3617 domain-containing protein [Gammaproteobacteria bacterium]TLY87467.1 MAG: DUF3617 domain-containing protein [Gammaproteobacteria bacterium]